MLPFLRLLLLLSPLAPVSSAVDLPSSILDQPPSAVAADSPKLIFVLAGQSNMAGRGGVSGDRWDGVVPPACRPSPSVQRLSALLRWEEAREPLHAGIDVNKTCGVGPGMAFANAVRSPSAAGGGEEEAGVVGLVPCAEGGTRIAEWARGAKLYRRMVTRARAAVGKGGGRIGALLWYQGESDTVSRDDAEEYGARLEDLIRDVRSDLGLPGLVVIQVALASGEGNFIDIVREAQKGVKLPNVICVDAKGLPLEGDHLHLPAEAQVHLGNMLAAAYLNHETTKGNGAAQSFHHSLKVSSPHVLLVLILFYLIINFV